MDDELEISLYVVIVNYKSYEDTIKYIEQLFLQKKVNLKVIVVDNDSKNLSFEKIKVKFFEDSRVKIIEAGGNLGYAKGNNLGVKSSGAADRDLIIISNNDIDISSDEYLFYKWSKKHLSIKDVGLSAPTMLVDGKESKYSAWKIPTFKDSVIASISLLERIIGDRKKYKFENFNDAEIVDVLPGSLLMINMEMLKEISMFDEGTFLYMEEVILSRKISNYGLRNYLLRDITYEHFVSKTISSNNSYKKMRRILLDSVIYYHAKYDGIGKFKVYLLEFLFVVWNIEYFFVKRFKL
ncbi:glycosyltransferase [Shewanella fodinae]|uniref:Glycosyltransferase 2-like domain-containing protein n=1 Tax=Shewanella fodinae TaxID=552357 RepID=A0A4R2F0V3_9GAMM|nr:glycosyltransferase [Shewanella fodinae]TCN77394.1 hypothetical protein EDC91_1466 [Shewanella fodinae]